MSYKKIFWGIVLIMIGILFILKNAGIVFLSWHMVWSLWPVLIILWGISVIPVNGWIKLAASLVVVVAGFLLLQRDTDNGDHFSWNFNGHNNWNSDWNDNDSADNQQSLSEVYNDSIHFAKLNFEVAAGKFLIRDTTSKLIDLERKGTSGSYTMTSRDEDSLRILDVQFEQHGSIHNFQNDVVLKLNHKPAWDLDLDIGAASIDFDLSRFKVNNLNVEGGASSIVVKLGDLIPRSDVNIDAGASSIEIHVPKTSGCEVITNTFLSSRDLKGFNKVENHRYQTPGFDKSQKKIYISLEAGITSIDVTRY
ncbi:MAG: DUF5668 domain-containing protein [Bacteroidota bacterium]